MGKRGPARKPTAVKKAQGTSRPDREPENEPKPDPGQPALLPDEGDIFNQLRADLAPRLERIGLLTEADGLTFSALLQTAVDYIEFRQRCNDLDDKIMVTDTGYKQVTPEFSTMMKLRKDLFQFAARFGLDPSSRSGMSIAPKDKDIDEFAEYLAKSPRT